MKQSLKAIDVLFAYDPLRQRRIEAIRRSYPKFGENKQREKDPDVPVIPQKWSIALRCSRVMT